jgi:predicted TIM-barrel fold metal-dependent hydrolase
MDYRVISADDHIDLRWLPRDLWTQRLPVHLRERAPQVVDTDNGPHWHCDGVFWGAWAPYGSGQSQWALDRVPGIGSEGDLRPTTPDTRLEDMDRDGVDASVMYGPTDPLKIADPELRRHGYQAYNDWLTEFCSHRPERLIGVAQLSMEDPLGARDELERLATRGVRHFNILAARATPPVFEEAWEPFWETAEEIGLPIGFHLAVETGRVNRAQAQEPSNPMVARASRFAQGHPGYQLIEPITGLIFAGVLDRHPRLKIVMAESGLAWIPNMIQAMDRLLNRFRLGHEAAPEGTKLPQLKPSEYFSRQIWMTFQDDFYGIKMLNILPEDRVMWASDYPHPASTWPDSQGIIEQLMEGIEPATRQKVLVDNARVLYGL